ncbi:MULTISPECIES: Stk1 family PASTA domain-containing Ser/Thr kinase [Streptomyces]|uniref:non-specific serine/threonine protein kinase n=1 Tax=Streptomyces venezuelae TaxID=54571 RepID=A0A5P2ASD5_STRVZ|nr:Stk1 family PASTA domain-containing Ser/Thr kinase [Streptomyces venezuelae]QES21103.1 Stk1 family PASTA domain-containing Ser/Thr kinase [Streptomyces venezuelae]
MEEPRRLGGRYELGSVLGRGGMAEVYIAQDTRLGRTVAVKTLRADLARDPSFQARFRREAQSAASLNHPAIVAVYDTGEDYVDQVSIPYIVMEYVDGSTLRELLHSGRKLLPERTLEMTVGILQALEYSHRAGIVHRDIKPANVMLTRTGQVKVMDFGIARAMGDAGMTMTQTAAVIGTAQYLSPEQAKGEQVDARSDLYSTGCLLYELLTVRPPFIGDSPVAVAYQHVREEPQAPSNFDAEITPSMDAIVLKALVKDPDYRYQSADEMRADIEACLDGQPVAAAAAMGIGMGMGGAPAYGGGYGGYPEDQPTTALRQADPAGQTSMMPPINGDDGGYGYDDRPDRRRGGGQKKSNTSTILLALAGVLVLVGAIFIGVSLFDKKEGTPQVPVPQLVGQPLKAAEELAVNAQVKAVQAGTERCDEPKGSVCRQTPAADGSQMDTGATIQLYVSEGAPLEEVPDVIEQSQERAEQTLKDKGFKVKIEQEESEEDPGTVLRTNPDAGTKAEKNSEVTVTVAKQLQSTVPPVVGNPLAQAEQQLKNLGFTVVTQYVDSDQPKDQVVKQSPDGNSSVAKNSEVTLQVSKGPQVTQVQIPTDIATKQFKDVKAQLEALGLVVTQANSDKEDATVITSNPAPGSMVNVGDPVTVITVGGGGNPGGNPGGGDGGNPGGGDSGDNDGGGFFG